MGMKFEPNIMFSAAAHVTLIAIALIFAGSGAVSRVPERYVRVTLVGQADQAHSTPTGGVKSSVKKMKATMLGPAAGTRKPVSPAPRRKAAEALTPEHKRSVVRPMRISVPLPGKVAEVPKTSTGGEKERVPGTGERNFLFGSDRFTIDISQYSTAEPAGHAAGTAGPPHSAEGGASSSDSHEKGAGGDGVVKTGGKGRNEAIGEIRAAIEKARRYPLFARERGIEGTVTTEFSINTGGLPENIRIKTSSGFDVLDSAAEETIIRAAPFPVVKGTIEVPIRFRLGEKEQ